MSKIQSLTILPEVRSSYQGKSGILEEYSEIEGNLKTNNVILDTRQALETEKRQVGKHNGTMYKEWTLDINIMMLFH